MQETARQCQQSSRVFPNDMGIGIVIASPQ
jgi:hypothetical protein